MDAVIFPDPAAPEGLRRAAARQCLEAPHVMVIGFDIRSSFGHTRFSCTFWTKDGAPLEEEGALYPEVGSCKQEGEWVGDHTLVCRIPEKVLLEGSDEGIRFRLVNAATGADISRTLIARGQRPGGGGGARGYPAAQQGSAPPPRYRLALTHMYKNHQPGIVNWIEWHLAKGVEHFFLYDNNSEDDRHYTEEYERMGIVTRVKWPFCCHGKENNAGQRAHMNHALFKFGQLTDWLMSLDEDEYLVTETQGAKSLSSQLLALAADDTSLVGVEHSHILQRGCDDGGLQAGGGPVVQLGLVRAGAGCLPRPTGQLYKGKYFLRTNLAYELGFVYLTPHPTFHTPGEQIANATADSGPRLTIAHFRSDAIPEDLKRPEVSESVTERLAWIVAETRAFIAAKVAAAAAQ